MMKKIFTFLFVLIVGMSFGQSFTENNVTLSVTGLTENYQTYFKDNFSSLIETMNKLSSLDNSISPVKVDISYKDNQGVILMIANYDNQKQTQKLPSMIKSFLNSGKSMGSYGFSIYLPNNLMLCLNDYKFKVYTNSQFDSEINKFKIVIRLKNADGSWIQFYCREYIDYRGIPSYSFENYADIKYLKKEICSFETSNKKSLKEYYIWELNKAIKPDGTHSNDYYVYKFFEIEY